MGIGARSRWLAQRTRAGATLAVFLAAFGFMLALHAYGRSFTADGVHFQRHSSEDMMQTLSLLDLRRELWRSLLVLHIQPPLVDVLRGSLARLWPALTPQQLVPRVDQALYLLWALAYAGMAALVFSGLRRAPGGARLAAAAAAAFLLHPAAIYYATYLDGTLLTSFGILWLCRALAAMPARGAAVSLGAAYVFLFLLRSIFQWPALVVLIAALLLLRTPRRLVLAVVSACALLVGGYMAKQQLALGTLSTSSFAGSSCVRALGEEPAMGFSSPMTIPLGRLFSGVSFEGYPAALRRATKITGAHNYNHVADLYNERRLLGVCRQKLLTTSSGEILRSYAESASIFLEPSSQYLGETNVVVDRLPWRGVYDRVFSGVRLLGLVTIASVLWLVRLRVASSGRQGELRRGLALALPVLFVTTASIVLERGENMRFKFFVEPVVYVFIVSELAAGASRLATAVRRRPTA